SSSQTNSTGGSVVGAAGGVLAAGCTTFGAGGTGVAAGADGPDPDGPRYPREVRNSSIRRARTSAEIPVATGGPAGAFGRPDPGEVTFCRPDPGEVTLF